MPEQRNDIETSHSTIERGKTIGGDHYLLKIQPIEYVIENQLGFCEGNVVKYISRWRNKGGLQDLEKAKHYIDFLIASELDKAKSESTELQGVQASWRLE
jgi:hypothetical protein